MQLAGRDAIIGSVGMPIDVERAHTADTFAAVVVEDNGLLTIAYELLIEDIEHLEEGATLGYILQVVGFERTLYLGAALTPDLNLDIYILVHEWMLAWS
jgi:hypothetical protein